MNAKQLRTFGFDDAADALQAREQAAENRRVARDHAARNPDEIHFCLDPDCALCGAPIPAPALFVARVTVEA